MAPKRASSKEDLEPARAVLVRHAGRTWNERIGSSHEANFSRGLANSQGQEAREVREPVLRKAASPFNRRGAVRQDTRVLIEETDSSLAADSSA